MTYFIVSAIAIVFVVVLIVIFFAVVDISIISLAINHIDPIYPL